MKTEEVEILAEIGLCERYFCAKGLIGNGEKNFREIEIEILSLEKLMVISSDPLFFHRKQLNISIGYIM